jgi:hypothetical protein
MTAQDNSLESKFEALEFLNQSKQFLNKEFLTWLWFYAESHPGPQQCPNPEAKAADAKSKPITFYLWIDDRLILESLQRSAAKSHQHVMKGGDPSHSPEASVALLSGKVVKELKMGCRILPYGDFSAVLSGTDLNPRSLTLPRKPDESTTSDVDASASQDDDHFFATRLRMMRTFLTVLDHLIGVFIQDRVKDTYETDTARKMQQWVKDRPGERWKSNGMQFTH